MSASITDLPARMQAKIVVAESGCWLWTAAITRGPCGGYGLMNTQGRMRVAHRVTYELLVGPIPEGLQIDHLCRVRNCVNPAHMEPVTQAENIRRGLAGQNNAVKTHCPQGHPYAGENLVTQPQQRQCRTCLRAAEARYRARKAAAKQPA